jgi:hypothetical protein
MINTVSATQRLASRGNSLKTSNEVTAAITGCITAKLVDVLMVALGSCFESLSDEDVNTIFELYEATPSVAMTVGLVEVPDAPDSVAKHQASHPPLLHETGGDEAARSPAASIEPVPAEKDTLSSLKDDLLIDENPCGDRLKLLGELPVNSQIPQWHTLG